MYALRHKQTGDLMTVSAVGSGDADFCVGYEAELNRGGFGDIIWVARCRETAERAAENSSEWYNASLDSPQNNYVGELEVVELGVK